jgi:hypothetical protein
MVRYANTIAQFWKYKIERYGATYNNTTRVVLPLPAEIAHEHQAFRLYSKTSVGRIAEYRFIADAHLENYLGVNLLMMFPELEKEKNISSKPDSA